MPHSSAKIYFLNRARHSFHAIYIGEEILGVGEERVRAEIDAHNKIFSHAPDRRFMLGIPARHPQMLLLETVEVDMMPVDPSLPLLFKPANQLQERIVSCSCAPIRPDFPGDTRSCWASVCPRNPTSSAPSG
ncbi:hypothetical protein Q5425_01455 [Amycolatopsis sp. A133]|uniref:hypothetical protein n=1 Tax=Amycolatopsis sp. A133 TaxID=3064472 RepID=UPI00280043D1|nr:hypothetical protein [Amycolatopsis sp. A133]MDQ7802379.1 hypothetical protein [Amycolatopsis sp. A133]